MKTTYSLNEVAKLLAIEADRAAGLAMLIDDRPRVAFSFADLVLLRAIKSLEGQQLPEAKFAEALKTLQARMPRGPKTTAAQSTGQGTPSSRFEASRLYPWDGRDGQGAFDFEGFRIPPCEKIAAETLFQQGVALEEDRPADAVDRYAEALAQNPRHADAHVNLGRLLHTRGHLREAEAHYVASLVIRPNDATATFNLAVVLEDLGRVDEAITRYTEALRLDAHCVDAYFNLSRLYEKKGEKIAALRHLKDYRRLLGKL